MIACVEEPALIAKILGHVQARDELVISKARAPPVHQVRELELV